MSNRVLSFLLEVFLPGIGPASPWSATLRWPDVANQDLGVALRCVTDHHPKSWSSRLCWIEYTHNSLVWSATGMSPLTAANDFYCSQLRRQRWLSLLFRNTFVIVLVLQVAERLWFLLLLTINVWQTNTELLLWITSRNKKSGYPLVTSLSRRNHTS